MDANYFANLIASAPVQSSSRYFEAGVYLVKIDGAKIFMNRQRRPRAAVDCTVIDSNNRDFPQTTQVSWVVALDSDSGPSTIKTFICDLTGCSPAEAATMDVINKFFPNVEADPNAGASVSVGLHALVNAFEKPTKSGGVYTKVSWRAFDPSKDSAPDFASMASPQVTTSPDASDFGGAPVTDNVPF